MNFLNFSDLPVNVDAKHEQILEGCHFLILDYDKMLAYDHTYKWKGGVRTTECFLLSIDYEKLKCEIADHLKMNTYLYPKFVDQCSDTFGMYLSMHAEQIGSKMVSFKDVSLQVGEDIPVIPLLDCVKRVGPLICGLRLHSDIGKRDAQTG